MNLNKMPYWVKFAACLLWYVATFVTDSLWFAAPHTPWYLRLAAVLVVVVPASYACWTYVIWNRSADEYQRLLGYRAVFHGAATAVLQILLGYWLAEFGFNKIFCLASLPFWMTSNALAYRKVLDRRP